MLSINCINLSTNQQMLCGLFFQVSTRSPLNQTNCHRSRELNAMSTTTQIESEVGDVRTEIHSLTIQIYRRDGESSQVVSGTSARL